MEPPDAKPPVHLLVTSPDAAGGIARSTASLANGLADDGYAVQVIGLRRLGSGRRFPLDPRVRVRYVADQLGPLGRWTDKVPSPLLGFNRAQGHSAHIDLMLRRTLRSLAPGVVLSTRPSLHLAAVRHAGHCATIGQDHVNFRFRVRNHSLSTIRRAIRRLDRFVVLTEADAADYREAFPEVADRIHVIHNAAPWQPIRSEPARSQVVLAAGHLSVRKGFDRLIEAYARLAPERPGWQLHIYGSGPRRKELRALIRHHRLTGTVQLKGRITAMEQVMEQAAIFAMTSRHEGFPMVLVEAMTKGMPIISYDCPRGPSEIIDDTVTGFLIDDGDETGFSDALGALMDDASLRRRMGAAAREHAHAYRQPAILRSWTTLIDRAGHDVTSAQSPRQREAAAES